MYKSLCEHAFSSLGHTPRNEIAVSNGNSVLNSLRGHQAIFQVAALLYSATSGIYGFQLLHILIDSCFFIMAIPVGMGMKWVLYCAFGLYFPDG